MMCKTTHTPIVLESLFLAATPSATERFFGTKSQERAVVEYVPFGGEPLLIIAG